jgi:hypothetical protein
MKKLALLCVALSGACAVSSNLTCPPGQLDCKTAQNEASDAAANMRNEPMKPTGSEMSDLHASDSAVPALQPDAESPAANGGAATSPQPDAGQPVDPGRTDAPEDDAGRDEHVPLGPIDKVDLLFVVDNSNSMIAKQASLKAALPGFIQELTTGMRATGEPSGYPALRDLHVGVVSTDMGTAGVNIGACNADGGDDGRLLHTPHGADCQTSYPDFLSFDAGGNPDSAQLARDFGCIATLGTGGCGFEQSLEAPLKALWPSVYVNSAGDTVTPNPITFLSTTPQGTLGHGDVPAAQGGNLGFLRNDPADPSLIALVLLSDEDDCSARTTEIFKPNSQLATDSPYRSQDINLRCFYNKDKLFDVQQRYFRAFRMLRADPRRVVFAAIAGVPADLVDQGARSAVDLSDQRARDGWYEQILKDARMQEVIDPSTQPGTGTGDLTPSCNRMDAATGHDLRAAPPRRIVELAKLFGAQGIVQSICQDDFAPATDAVVDLIGAQLVAKPPR